MGQGFEEKTVGAIGREVLEGVAYLHRHEVIHRDIKVRRLPFSACLAWFPLRPTCRLPLGTAAPGGKKPIGTRGG